MPYSHLHPIASALIFATCLVMSDSAHAQRKSIKEQIVGVWTLVKFENTRPDGTKFEQFGPRPQGTLIFTSDGRYSLQFYSPDRPKFASNNQLQGTPDEYKDAVHGSLTHYGRYSVRDTEMSLTFHVERSNFANWEGQDHSRAFTLNVDEMTYHVPSSATTGTALVALRRAK